MVNSTLIAAVSVFALVLSQVPTDTTIGDVSKFGGLAGAMFIIWWLSTRTIPQITSDHRESMEALSARVHEGHSDIKDSLDKGHDRIATLLQATLVKLIEDKRGGPKQ